MTTLILLPRVLLQDILDVKGKRCEVVDVVLELPALGGEPQRDLLLSVDTKTPLVLQHFLDREPRNVQAEISLREA